MKTESENIQSQRQAKTLKLNRGVIFILYTRNTTPEEIFVLLYVTQYKRESAIHKNKGAYFVLGSKNVIFCHREIN
jgi:hypothetical protein